MNDRQLFMKRCELTHIDCLLHRTYYIPLSQTIGDSGKKKAKLRSDFSCESCDKKLCSVVAKCTSCRLWICLDVCASTTATATVTNEQQPSTIIDDNNLKNISSKKSICTTTAANTNNTTTNHGILIESKHKNKPSFNYNGDDENDSVANVDRWVLCNHCASSSSSNNNNLVAMPDAATTTTTTNEVSVTFKNQRSVSYRPAQAILKRVVFVLELSWKFRMAQEILNHVFDVVPDGSALVYGLRCNAKGEWSDAFAWIRRFATEPRRYLPDSYCYVDSDCCIDVVIGTHSARDDGAAEVDLRYANDGSTGTLADWIKMIALMFEKVKQANTTIELTTTATLSSSESSTMLSSSSFSSSYSSSSSSHSSDTTFTTNTNTTTNINTNINTTTNITKNIHNALLCRDSSIQINTLYFASCHLFGKEKARSNTVTGATVGLVSKRRERTMQRLRKLAEDFDVVIMACDGDVYPFVQATVIASHIITTLSGGNVLGGADFATDLIRISPDGRALLLEQLALRHIVVAPLTAAIVNAKSLLMKKSAKVVEAERVLESHRRTAARKSTTTTTTFSASATTSSSINDNTDNDDDEKNQSKSDDVNTTNNNNCSKKFSKKMLLQNATFVETFLANRQTMLQSRLALERLSDNQLIEQLCARWPFTRIGERIGNTLDDFGKVFDVAAVISVLDKHNVQRNKLAQAIHNYLKRSVTEQLPTIATILNRLAWLSNHVAIDAILDTKLQHWSFERALLSGLVEPPLFSPFSKTITAATIAELRDECRIEWARFDGIVSRAKLK